MPHPIMRYLRGSGKGKGCSSTTPSAPEVPHGGKWNRVLHRDPHAPRHDGVTVPIVCHAGESGAIPANVTIQEGPNIHDSITWLGMDRLGHDPASLFEGE